MWATKQEHQMQKMISIRWMCYGLVVVTVNGSIMYRAAAQQPSRGADPARIFERMDRNGDGFIDRDEAPARMQQQFDRFDSDRDGKVSLTELRRNLPGASPAPTTTRPARRPGEEIAPAARQERQREKLEAGDSAPDFTLPLAQGDGMLTLADLYRDKPVVLVFGSISCSPFRQQVEQVEQLYQQYRERANFVMVYIREAHPDSVIYVKNATGNEVLQKILQTDDVKLRTEHAETCTRTLQLSFPLVVDGADNRVNAAYAGWPIRLVIIGTDGKIIDPGAPGPQGFQPQKVAQWLKSRS